MAEKTMTLAQVIGENARKLRGNNTLEDVASHGRQLGARWSSGSISAIERGEFKPTIETILLLCQSLSILDRGRETMGESLTIRELLTTDVRIQISPSRSLKPDKLLEFLEGKPSMLATWDGEEFTHSLQKLAEEREKLNLPRDTSLIKMGDFERDHPLTSTEERLAKRAGINVTELREWSFYLWETSFEKHRDSLAGAGSSPQKKGRISRELLAEIEESMKNNGVD